jgi:hypothetical protein
VAAATILEIRIHFLPCLVLRHVLKANSLWRFAFRFLSSFTPLFGRHTDRVVAGRSVRLLQLTKLFSAAGQHDDAIATDGRSPCDAESGTLTYRFAQTRLQFIRTDVCVRQNAFVRARCRATHSERSGRKGPDYFGFFAIKVSSQPFFIFCCF